MDDEKVYFHPGDVVQLRQDVTNRPTMIVKSKDTIADDDAPRLLGITCMWFNTNMELQTARFSTKDLEKCQKMN